MAPIEVQLIPERSYTVKCGDKRIEGMRVTGVWEGMTRLQGADGRVLVIEPHDGPLSRMFKEALADIGIDNDYPRCAVVKGSPDLLEQLAQAKE